MTPAGGFLQRISEALEVSGVRWMITGSAASTFYGEPRATQDLDVVIDPGSGRLPVLFAALRRSFYLSEVEAEEAIRRGGMFNAVDLGTGWKADFIVCSDAFTRRELARSRVVSFAGVTVAVISPEGSIISKLRWAAASGSERQIRDAASVVEACRTELDLEYIRREAAEAGVAHLLLAVGIV